MSRCFCWRCALVFGIIITNFALSNNTFNLFSIYLLILQRTTVSAVADFRYTQPSVSPTFGNIIIALSILAHFQNGDQQKTSNTDDERVPQFQLQRHTQKKFRYAFRDYFRHAYKLYTSLRQPSTRTGEFLWPQPASGPTRASPGIKMYTFFNFSVVD